MNASKLTTTPRLTTVKATCLLVVASALLLAAPAFAYPNVTITNITQYPAGGTVNYPSCHNDDYLVQPGYTWTRPDRGACLITWISATLKTTNGTQLVQATNYTSTGTGYGEFYITPSG